MAALAVVLVSGFGPAPGDDKPAALAVTPEVDQATGVRWYRDVAYVEGDGAHPIKHKLDLLLPAADKWRAGRPMVIWIHGGGWTMGDKDDALGLYTKYCRILAENGVGTANISYRLSPGVKHPAHIEDVAAATAWVIKHAGELGFDAKAVFVSGHSAGGHLAALLAADHGWLEKHGLPKGSLAGAIPSSGIFDLKSMVASSDRWQRVFAAEDAADASPVTHVDGEDPPFAFMVEGNGVYMQAQTNRMVRSLKEKGVEEQIVTLAGVNHITMLMDLLDPKGAHLTTTLGFIDKVLAKPEEEEPQMDTESHR
jgi:arylformamidase